MAVTQKDIAQRLGISQQTVACALSGTGRSRMSDETRQRVLQEAQLLNYRPNLAARALTQQRSNLIAVWTQNLYSPFYAHLLHHIEMQLRSSGYEMMVRVIPENTSFLGKEKKQAPQWPVDGILAIETAGNANEFIKLNGKSAPPIVIVGGIDETLPELDYVWVDLYKSTYQAVEHLIAQGSQRVATLIHSLGFQTDSPRFCAYRDAMAAAGREPEYIVVPETTRAAAVSILRSYTKQNGFPDALFCYNDDLAIGAYRFLRDSGKSIPNDVALVGCDGIEDVEYLEHPLSTIVTPVEQMCATAWEMLQVKMKDNNPAAQPKRAMLDAHLEIRASSLRIPTS